jgi:hypothetical protein
MKKEFNAIQNYFTQGARLVVFNKTWKNIHEEHGVGNPHGRLGNKPAITFTDKDRDFLRNWMIEETGLDPLSKLPLPKSRVEAASKGKNEKVSTRTVFGQMLKIARADGNTINTHTGPAIIPPRCFMSIESANLNLKNEIVIIIENGELIREWSSLSLPKELTNALLIYRGHEDDAKEIKRLLESDPPALSIGFYDFDPAGILIGLSNNHDALLVPADISQWKKENPEFRQFNQPNVFWKQGEQLLSVENKARGDVLQLLDSIKSENIAVMQEHMVAKHIPLKIIEL